MYIPLPSAGYPCSYFHQPLELIPFQAILSPARHPRLSANLRRVAPRRLYVIVDMKSALTQNYPPVLHCQVSSGYDMNTFRAHEYA
ncbi:hypothetical protein Ppro_2597 [Pelobacter propionicus DSM 2379]|uniref:Uncharacterized protein n=1 Tax=Pelobacter propionicus (strain DSM 2379 / NBRC 103807 / OttBd1) TaxID=338966 RepID=A1AS81_PELPD|nr:hypothetical protein Ppro_2597 [Pelobacter propionicus DSM 2379]